MTWYFVFGNEGISLRKDDIDEVVMHETHAGSECMAWNDMFPLPPTDSLTVVVSSLLVVGLNFPTGDGTVAV